MSEEQIPGGLRYALDAANEALVEAGLDPVQPADDGIRSWRAALKDASSALADADTDEDEEPADDPQQGRRRKPSRVERLARRETQRERERAAGLERELAFEKARLPDTAGAQWFRERYDGKPTVEAIREAYSSLGLPDTPAHELAAHQRVAEASAGATTTAGPLSIHSEQYERELAACQTPEEVAQVMDRYGSPRVQE